MSTILHRIAEPWPWYVAGPLIGLFVPLLLLLGNRQFGVSGGLRSLCAAILPSRAEFFRFDWKRVGAWNIAFIVGIVIGGFLASLLVASRAPEISEATRTALSALGVQQISGFAPQRIFAWPALLTVPGMVSLVGGGLLVGFGTAYGGGCTSGHGITGLATLQAPSAIALAGFFAGGLAATYLLLPVLLG